VISVSINNLGKKFGREWIFRNLSFEINAGDKLVILGGNGSGKSTLLQVISGFVSQNEGEIIYRNDSAVISSEKLKDLVSFASPYLQLVEDFTLEEMIEHAALFKPFKNSLSAKELMEKIELSQAKNKFIRQFSSGMKQRLKLGLAVLADTPLLLLDEPVSNLDRNAIEWYRNLMNDHMTDRTVIVCSNAITEEYSFCKRELNVMDFKSVAANKK
jgi:ABC-type multidrug transport system ATPase subunit